VGLSNTTSGTASSTQKRSADSTDQTSTTKRSRTTKKAASEVNGAEPEFKKPVLPVTPLRQRRTAAAKDVPSLTPTPSLVNIIRAPYNGRVGEGSTPPPEDRPVDPHVTNAKLITPGGTKKVAYRNNTIDSSPSKNGLPAPTSTTGSILHEACAHLVKVDSRLKPIIEQHPCDIFSAKGLAEIIDPFQSLTSGIMGQQVSGAAAKSIKNKFIGLFNAGNAEKPIFPTPAQVAVTDIPRLRTAGLSERKAEYIKGLAEKFHSGELSADMLMTASDEEVMEKLIAVRGLGKWSVEMFACFSLKRLDILSTGDLGVQRGMAAFYGKDVKKLKAKGGGKWKYMSEQDMLDKSAPFAPYRSLYMWYRWRVEDVDVDVMQQ
jgi:DNA-3-methyladenine glycosylase II